MSQCCRLSSSTVVSSSSLSWVHLGPNLVQNDNSPPKKRLCTKFSIYMSSVEPTLDGSNGATGRAEDQSMYSLMDASLKWMRYDTISIENSDFLPPIQAKISLDMNMKRGDSKAANLIETNGKDSDSVSFIHFNPGHDSGRVQNSSCRPP